MNRAGNSRLGRSKIKILERQIILRDPQILRDIVMVADIGISRNWVLYAHIYELFNDMGEKNDIHSPTNSGGHIGTVLCMTICRNSRLV
jgi:hypothetical protein